MILTFLTSWLQRRAVPLPHLHFVMYTRQGCHMCDDAWQLLEAARQRHGFALAAVDVDRQPALAAKYGEMVPVVEVNGKLRFWGRINRVLVERLLRAERL
jgi:glutaredoxin